MSDSNYDVYVIKMLEVAYDATIDQTARFDGLYKGMIWPYNHGDVPGNHDARPLHGTSIHVTREATLNTGMTFVEFSWKNNTVWISKEGIIPPKLAVKTLLTNQLATLVDGRVNYPYFKAIPQTQSHSHIPVGYLSQSSITAMLRFHFLLQQQL